MKVKNIDSTLENLDKCVLNSLSFLDNKNVYISIIFILFLFNTCLFTNINNLVSEFYQNPIVKVVMLLLVIYVSRKSYLIGLLLALSYVISLNYKSVMENFVSGFDSTQSNFESVNNNEKFVNNEENEVTKSVEETESFDNHVMSEGMGNESFDNHVMSEGMGNESFDNHVMPEGMNNESFQGSPLDESSLAMNGSTENESFSSKGLGNSEPVETFNKSMNTQGLNVPTGFDSNDNSYQL